MSALFGAKNVGFFEIYGVSARTRGEELNFSRLCADAFMYGPLSNRWPLQYGVLQQCVKLVMTSGVARIFE